MGTDDRARAGAERMLVGSADLDVLARHAATVESYRREAVELTGVECFQLTAAMRRNAREAVLPAALHPTSPASLSIQIWNVGANLVKLDDGMKICQLIFEIVDGTPEKGYEG